MNTLQSSKQIPTPELAKKYALRQFSEYGKKQIEEKGKKVGKLQEELKILHSHCVFTAIREIIKLKSFEGQIDLEELEIAAWLHDVGYVLQKENHAKYSLEMCEQYFIINNNLRDCILNHGRKSNPKTKEGKVIQLADKLSLFYPKFRKKFIEASIAKGLNPKQAEERYNQRKKDFADSFPEDEVYNKLVSKLSKKI